MDVLGHRTGATTRAAAVVGLVAVLLAGFLASPASAQGAPEPDVCLLFGVAGDEEFTTRLVRGGTYFVFANAYSNEGIFATDPGFFCQELAPGIIGGPTTSLAGLPTTALISGVAWHDLGTRNELKFEVDGADVPSVWTLSGDVLTTTLLEDPDEAVVFGAFRFDVAVDAPLGDYEGTVTFVQGMEEITFNFAFTIVAPRSRTTGPAATVTCDTSAPVVGATVTCTVASGAPDFDIVWTASTNPVFASGVVRTDASGNGRFSFVVPASAVGQELLIELVDWTRPTSIGVVGGPVPGAVPAGEGPGSLPIGGMTLLVVGVLAPFAARRLQTMRSS
jgi:hypothetical protein